MAFGECINKTLILLLSMFVCECTNNILIPFRQIFRATQEAKIIPTIESLGIQVMQKLKHLSWKCKTKNKI